MNRWNLVLALAIMAAASAWLAVGVGGDGDARARRLHFSSLVLDTHIDTPLQMKDPNWDFGQEHESGHVDLPASEARRSGRRLLLHLHARDRHRSQGRQRLVENHCLGSSSGGAASGIPWNCAPTPPVCAGPNDRASSPCSWGWRGDT